jgi:predicted aspartyl protease
VPVTPLRRAGRLLVVTARLWDRGGGAGDVNLALDTAATETLITPRTLARFGYHTADSLRVTTIRSAVGVERGYLLRVARLWALGFEVQNEIVHAHELPEQDDIDGLLGLRFLDRLDYTLWSRLNQVEARLAMS